MNPGPTATKKNVLEQLLEQGMVLVALDARVDGVDVPTHLGKDPQLRLNLSYRFGLPMSVDEWGVCATLTFAGIPYNCRFPWNSIFLMVSHVSGQPYLFPDDIPAELLSQAPEMAAAVTPPPPAASRKPAATRPKLTLVASPEPAEGDAEAAAPAADADAAAPASPADAVESHPVDAKPEPATAEAVTPVPPADSSGPDENSPRPRRSRRRGHLRLVK